MEHRIEITPAKHKYAAAYQGEKIGEFRVPECDSARWLVAQGHAQPGDTMVTTRNGVPAMRGSVAWLAGQTVEENEKVSPRWVKWRPFAIRPSERPETVDGSAQEPPRAILEGVAA
jgi:hypothetical protein